MRNEGRPIVRYECIRRIISLVKAKNERVYAIANPTVTSIPGIIIKKEGEGVERDKVASVALSVIVEVNDSMNLFKSLLFADSVFYQKERVGHLKLATITDEVKELIGPVSATSVQRRLLSDSMVSLVEDISVDKDYLSKSARFP